MWTKKMRKLSVFLLLMLLVHLCKGELLEEILTAAGLPRDRNGGIGIAENLNLDKDSGLRTITITEAAQEGGIEIPNVVTESNTNEIECVCDCTANGNQVTVACCKQAPQEGLTDDDSDTFINDSTLPDVETTTQTTAEEESTTAETDAATTEAPPPLCSTPDIQPHEVACEKYYDCTLEGSLDGNLHLFTKTCPEKQAFNIQLNRCSRDISSCTLPIQCLVKGGLADPASNSSYYLCELRLIGIGFRIFHIDCAANEIFYPELGKCFVDFNNLPTLSFAPYNWNQIRDIDIVKAELKLLKKQDKFKLKQEKELKKAAEKLQKESEKEAKKKAKEEAKLNEKRAKLQATDIVCQQEGNLASEISDNIYYACINKKGKLKATPMQCSFGATFNAESGICTNSTTNVDNKASDDEDDDY